MPSGLQVPPELVLQSIALGNTTALISFVGLLIKKTREVASFRDECADLTNRCIVLSLALLDRKSSLGAYRATQSLQTHLRDVFLLVSECSTKWSVRHIGWELIFEQKVKAAKERLDRWHLTFNSEVLMGVNEQSDAAIQHLQSLHTEVQALQLSVQSDIPERQQYLAQVGRLTAELFVKTRFISIAASSFLIEANDGRLVISQYVGTEPVAGLFDASAVTFARLGSLHKDFDHIMKVYKMIGSMALVQQVFALVEINGFYYAIVQDLRTLQTLSNYIAMGESGKLMSIDKLRFLYELAATLSALHRNGLMVKNLSDETILIDTSAGYPRPMLTDLQSARVIWEVTTREDQDIRYEAPEVSKLRMHSQMTDIWSFAVVALQFLHSVAPYGTTSSNLTDGTMNEIRQKLETHVMPFDKAIMDTESPLPHVLRQCLCVESRLRPTANAVAQSLHESLVEEGVNELLGPSNHSLETKQQAEDLDVEQILNLVDARASSRGKNASLRQSEDAQNTRPFTRATLKKLIESSNSTSPQAYFAVGCAYYNDLVKDAVSIEVNSGIASNRVVLAKLALPYLDQACQLGHVKANKELCSIYKLLAEHHRDEYRMAVGT